MKPFSRRNFLKTASLAPFALKSAANGLSRVKPLLSFSTLGCPDWTFDEILDFAAANHYSGIELRGIQRELDLTKRPEFDTPEHIKASKEKIAAKGLKIVDLGSSAALHHSEGAERQKNLDEGKRFIDLAMQLDCPYVRVFPNELPKTGDRQNVIDLIIDGLKTLGDYVQKGNVTVIMESHGDAVQTDELKHIMQSAASTHVGLLWDIVNMWAVTKQPPAQVYAQLKEFIRHTHIKDLKFENGKEQYVRLLTGEAPILEGIDALYKGGYRGYYSFEWEKLWHPEIEEPEIVLADYPVKMLQHFKKL